MHYAIPWLPTYCTHFLNNGCRDAYNHYFSIFAQQNFTIYQCSISLYSRCGWITWSALDIWFSWLPFMLLSTLYHVCLAFFSISFKYGSLLNLLPWAMLSIINCWVSPFYPDFSTICQNCIFFAYSLLQGHLHIHCLDILCHKLVSLQPSKNFKIIRILFNILFFAFHNFNFFCIIFGSDSPFYSLPLTGYL